MIYLDYNATTPVLPEVLEAMLPYFNTKWGNPSSPYLFSKAPSEAIFRARVQVADLIGAQPNEIVFTSCATESNQTALYNGWHHTPNKKVLMSAVEHSSIIEYQKSYSAAKSHSVNVDDKGFVDLDQLSSYCSQGNISMVSVMWANNETGVVSQIDEISDICQKYDVLFHTDAAQAAGKVIIDLGKTKIDYLSLSSHKFFGPKGIGALYIRHGTTYNPLLIGQQQSGLRGGTEPVAQIVGMGKAAEVAKKLISSHSSKNEKLRNFLEKKILNEIPDSYLNGCLESRLPNTLNISFKGIDANSLVLMLSKQGIYVSNGSACHSSTISPSHVLIAMGKSYEYSNSAIRFSLSHLNKEAEIDEAVCILAKLTKSLRGL